MSEPDRYRTLQEQPEFTAQFDFIIHKYSDNVIGPILAGVMWGIATNPKAYSRTIGTIREAKTRSFGLTTPTFRVFFQIMNEDRDDEYVLLCWIEETSTTDEITEYLM
jgi:hypothetical protein